MREYFVKSQEVLFGDSDDRARVCENAQRRLSTEIAAASDEQVLEAEPETWADGLAEKHALETPTVETEAHQIEAHGRVQVDCTGAPGINYSLNEATVLRDGYRMRVEVPYSGNADLLRTYSSTVGLIRIPVEVEADHIVQTWEWPDVLGADRFQGEVETFLNDLRRGTDAVDGEVAKFNSSLRDQALKEINTRREQILAERKFLGDLKLPIRRDQDAPKEFKAPPIQPRESPAGKAQAAPPEDPIEAAPLGEFYEHILEVIRAVGRGLERSPGSFRDAEEGVLRDHMLVTLNRHCRGVTYAEAFNREGRTDILIRVHDKNAFIAECKWWSGPKALDDALDQLFGYTTWQDSRVALIFYVKARNITEIVSSAKEQLEKRDEFVAWETSTEERELRCRVKWPDDPAREATLTAVFVHLPEKPGEKAT